MMLPVGVTLITLTSARPQESDNLAAVILFSIAYGCSIAGVATPSGGARNAIIISYWKDLFYDPLDPNSRRYLMDYLNLVDLRLSDVPDPPADRGGDPRITFRPETTDMSRSVSRLRTQGSWTAAQTLRLAHHPHFC